MWSEVSQIRQPHDGVLEANKQGGNNEAEQKEQIDLRAQSAVKLAREILDRTGYEVSGRGEKGFPYGMRGNVVDVGELTGEAGEKGFRQYMRACLGFDKELIQRGRWVKRMSIGDNPDFEKVRRLSVIYLSGLSGASEGELTHQKSAHWSQVDFTPLGEVLAIEEGLETIQNALGGPAIISDQQAS